MIENTNDEEKVISINRDEVFFYDEAMKSHPIRSKVIGRPKDEADDAIRREILSSKLNRR